MANPFAAPIERLRFRFVRDPLEIVRPDRHAQRWLVRNRYVEHKALTAQSSDRAGAVVGAEPVEQSAHAQQALEPRPLQRVGRSVALAPLSNQSVERIIPGR